MNSENKICQNCREAFTIDASDFDFYQKIQVPAPTWCPECRMIRRLAWRNEHFIYKRKSTYSGQDIFSNFAPEVQMNVVENSYWYGDEWSALNHGKEIDWNRPFLNQVKELSKEVPIFARSVSNLSNSDYCNNATGLKNCYLVFNASYMEDCLYSCSVTNSRSSMDIFYGDKNELCYECFFVNRSYRAFYSSQCEDCSDIWFCKNLRGCSDCFGSVNLSGKKYYFFNQPLSREEYLKKMSEIDTSSYREINRFVQLKKDQEIKFPSKFMDGNRNQNVSGNYISNSKNCRNCFLVIDSQDLRFCQDIQIGNTKDSYDYSIFGDNTERIYESTQVGLGAYNIKFSAGCWTNVRNMEYCLYCGSSSDLFGCVGMRNGKFCILNKQYTEEEYNNLLPRLREHMKRMPYIDKAGKKYPYGEFLPMEMSFFRYNETIAYEYAPISREEAEQKSLTWKDYKIRSYVPTVKSEDLPDRIDSVPESITSEVIACAGLGNERSQCSTAFRVVPEELAFYRRLRLPLPRYCFNCRHYNRLLQRLPVKTWLRRCQCQETSDRRPETSKCKNTAVHFHGDSPCPNEFETSYAPDRPEIIYCEQCYNAEVA